MLVALLLPALPRRDGQGVVEPARQREIARDAAANGVQEKGKKRKAGCIA